MPFNIKLLIKMLLFIYMNTLNVICVLTLKSGLLVSFFTLYAVCRIENYKKL